MSVLLMVINIASAMVLGALGSIEACDGHWLKRIFASVIMIASLALLAGSALGDYEKVQEYMGPFTMAGCAAFFAGWERWKAKGGGGAVRVERGAKRSEDSRISHSASFDA